MNRRQLCEEYHIPYFPSMEECEAEDDRGDYEYHMNKELDDAPPDPTK